jgi:hypothetical protein
MNRLITRVAGLVAAVVLLWAPPAPAETYVFYEFEFQKDGIDWPDTPPGIALDGAFTTPDGVRIGNYTNNNLFVDDNFLLPRQNIGFEIDGSALWADPKISSGGGLAPGPSLEFDFTGADYAASFFEFWFAWSADTDILDMTVYDSLGNSVEFGVVLDEAFDPGPAFADGLGYAGPVFFGYDELQPLANIESIVLNLEPAATLGGTEQFLVDDFYAELDMPHDGGDGEFDPDNSDVFPQDGLTGLRTNRLRNSFGGSFDFEIVNGGTGGTEISVELIDSDPELTPGSPIENETIDGFETIDSGPIVTYTADLPSGRYEAQARVVNDLNPDDPDDLVDYTVDILDPPLLTDNADQSVDTTTGPAPIVIANAPAGPHAGALRAGIEITGIDISHSGFALQDIGVGDFLAAGESLNGQVTFNPNGQLATTHSGTLTIASQMNSEAGGFLNGDQPVDDIVWTLLGATVPVEEIDTAQATAGQDLAELGLDVQNESTAVDILAGASTAAQAISLALNPDDGGFGPGFASSAVIVGDPVDIEFGGEGGVYVLQIVVSGEGLSQAKKESLRIKVYDPEADTWVDAVTKNSNYDPAHRLENPAGRYSPDTTFDEFIAAGGVIDPGYQGTYFDGDNMALWGVYDHNTVFGAGYIPEPATMVLLGLGGLMLMRRRR